MDTHDPFDLLGVPPQYRLDRAAVQRAYLKQSAQIHPDVAGDTSEEEAAALNSAKKTLDDPEQRAVALLKRRARELGHTFSPADERALPPAFLAEMMETREQIDTEMVENAERARQKWEGWAEERRRRHEASVGELFEALDKSPSPTALRSIRLELNCWRYIERLVDQLQ